MVCPALAMSRQDTMRGNRLPCTTSRNVLSARDPRRRLRETRPHWIQGPLSPYVRRMSPSSSRLSAGAGAWTDSLRASHRGGRRMDLDRIIVEKLHGHWSTWFDGAPQVAVGAATPAEAVDSLVGFTIVGSAGFVRQRRPTSANTPSPSREFQPESSQN